VFAHIPDIGIDVLERPAHEYRPSLSAYMVGAVDFEGDFPALVVDHVAWSSTDRDPRPAVEHDEPEVDGQHYRIVVDQERDSANVVSRSSDTDSAKESFSIHASVTA
jgi:hypothetical protein